MLRFAVLVESRRTELAADPRLFEAAPLGLRHVRVVVVDPHGPVAESCGDPLRPARVRRPNSARQAVRRVVPEPDRLVLRAEPLDRHDRAEDLLADDRHVGPAVGEHGGPEVEASLKLWIIRSVAAGDKPGAFVEAKSDVALDLVAVFGGDQGSGLGPLVEAVAHANLLSTPAQLLDEPIVD